MCAKQPAQGQPQSLPPVAEAHILTPQRPGPSLVQDVLSNDPSALASRLNLCIHL